MKKTLLLLALVLVPAAIFAQGTVNFANTVNTRVTTNSTPTPPPGQSANQTGNTAPANQYTIGLYIAPQGTTDPNAFSLMGPTVQNGGIAGLFNANPPGGFFVISNNTGQAIAFQVRAWHTFAGATYSAALGRTDLPNRYLGVSAIGETTPATGLATPPVLFGTNPGQVGGFALTPVIPEPSSIALGLLGLGAIALFRRRK